jgi:ABC-2 type transport system ATP-binding protein
MITVNNLSKSYGTKLVLDDINLEVEKGHVVGLVGPNGSGKSTLLRLISGVLEPNAGLVRINSEDVYDNPEIKSDVFFLGDEPYFFNQSTINDMKEFYKLFYPNFDETTYQELLDDFKLDPSVRINSFSKGMKRQVVLIFALAAKTKIILLDEAFDGLDPKMRFKLRQYISQEIFDREIIVIISSHNLRELEDICDTIVMIHNNKLQFSHTTDDVVSIYHKYQMVFNEEFDPNIFKSLNPLNVSGKERIFTLILKGDKEELDAKIKELNPLIFEHNRVSLEEIFIYEAERSDL